MAQFAIEDEEQVRAVIADVRNDSTPTDWCLVGYPDDNPGVIVLIGSGSGGVEEMRNYLSPTSCYYGIVRVTETIDKSETVKFCFLKYLGTSIKPMFKAKITVHQGAMQEKFKPFHVEMFAEDLGEVSQDVVMKLVSDASMSKSKVIERGAASAAAAAERAPVLQVYSSGKQPQKHPSSVLSPASKGNIVPQAQFNLFQDTEDEIREAIADVRNDSTETDWVLAAYSDQSNTQISLVGKGTGGVEALVSSLSADNIYYGLIRTTDVIDKSITVKFCFIHFLGESVKAIPRAKTSTHKGSVTKMFQPFHVELTATKQDEITPEVIKKLVSETSMSASKVMYREGEAPPEKKEERSVFVKEPVRQFQSPDVKNDSPIVRPKISSMGSNVFEFIELDKITAAIADLRNDKSETDYVVCSYVDDAGCKVGLIASGQGGADALKQHLTLNNIYYALVRAQDIIDNNVTVKFCFLTFQGENVKLSTKAKASTHKGNITQLFRPLHVELYATTLSEVSNELVNKLVSEGSMSSSRVLGEEKKFAPATSSPLARTKTQISNALEFINVDEIKAAIALVRNSQEVDWAMITYVDDSACKLALAASGDGGANALAAQLKEDQVAYGIVRVTDVIDTHVTVKFAFVHFLGPRMKPIAKAKTSTHKGQVVALFQPFHVELFAESVAAVNADAVNKLVSDASMSGSKVLNEPKKPVSISKPVVASPSSSPSSVPRQAPRTSSPAVARNVSTPPRSPSVSNSAGLIFDDEVKVALADVRNDATETNWALFGYSDKNKICLVGTGTGGVDEMSQHLDPKQVMYGVARIVEIIDASTTVKFAMISWLGEQVNPMSKARVSTHKGSIEQALHPFHVTMFTTSVDEVSEKAVKTLVAKASMAHNNVLNK